MTHTDTEKRVRLAVIGCADIAWRRTLPALLANPAVEVTVIASRDPAKAQRFTDRFGGTPLGDYGAVEHRDDVDAVYIPLPLRMHAEWVERSLRAYKHVLVEKPMTDSLATTQRLIALARASGLVLMENYMFLYHSQHAAVKRLIDEDAIGEVRGFSSSFTIPPKPAGDIRYQAAVGGGAFLDFGGYPVRAALHFLGDRLQVVGAVFRHDAEQNVVLSGSVLLSTDLGIPAQLTFGMEHSYRNSYRVAGSHGRISLDRVFTPPQAHEPVVCVQRQDERISYTLPPDHQFARITSAFVNAIRGSDIDQGHAGSLAQARLVEHIQEAAVRVAVGRAGT